MEAFLKEILELQKQLIEEEKRRLCEINQTNNNKNNNSNQYENCDNQHQQNNNLQQSIENKENQQPSQVISLDCDSDKNNPAADKNLPLIERLDLCSNDGNLEEKKQAFIDKIVNSQSPFSVRSDDNNKNKMLRYGEYSPNNPQLRVTAAAPYLGLGEYEQRRNYFLQKQRDEYLDHLSKNKQKFINTQKHHIKFNQVLVGKAVQTDLQNIHCPLVQYELHSQNLTEKESLLSPLYSNCVMQNSGINSNNSRHLSPTTLGSSSSSAYRVDQRLTSAQNALLKPLSNDMDSNKPKSILSNRRTGSPRERLLSDLKHSYTPSFMDGFSYSDRTDELERERLKRENYQHELRMQIEEKRRLQQMREEQERREQELENRRLEQQLLRMQEEQVIEDQRRARRHSEDLLRRKQELQSRHNYRKHTDSESSVVSSSCLRNTNVASTNKALSHYSPPVSRRNPYSFNIPSTSVFADLSASSTTSTNRYNNPPANRYDSSYSYSRKDALNRMDSLGGGGGLGASASSSYNNYDSSGIGSNRYNAYINRYDSLSRIDSLNRQDTLNRIESLNINDNNLSTIQRRHSATQQDLSTMMRRSPKLQRRSSSSRFEETLPIPVLKAHSPVAKELKHSVPFNSSRHSSTDAIRKLEDKWQIPAVQRNIINHNHQQHHHLGGGDSLLMRDGQNRSTILTQLGAIRMQLQQEQLRMDETLRKRGITQSKAVDFH